MNSNENNNNNDDSDTDNYRKGKRKNGLIWFMLELVPLGGIDSIVLFFVVCDVVYGNCIERLDAEHYQSPCSAH